MHIPPNGIACGDAPPFLVIVDIRSPVVALDRLQLCQARHYRLPPLSHTLCKRPAADRTAQRLDDRSRLIGQTLIVFRLDYVNM